MVVLAMWHLALLVVTWSMAAPTHSCHLVLLHVPVGEVGEKERVPGGDETSGEDDVNQALVSWRNEAAQS